MSQEQQDFYILDIRVSPCLRKGFVPSDIQKQRKMRLVILQSIEEVREVINEKRGIGKKVQSDVYYIPCSPDEFPLSLNGERIGLNLGEEIDLAACTDRERACIYSCLKEQGKRYGGRRISPNGISRGI
jgi:hypothetical protein